jgi:IS5 family transposase
MLIPCRSIETAGRPLGFNNDLISAPSAALPIAGNLGLLNRIFREWQKFSRTQGNDCERQCDEFRSCGDPKLSNMPLRTRKWVFPSVIYGCFRRLSLREFLRLGERDRVPDHSWLSKTRGHLAHEVHAAVFGWVLARLDEHGLIQGERIGVDPSTIEANAALRTIVRRDSGEGYRQMLKRMAVESWIETPSAEDLVRLDRARKGKKLSNADWVSKTDPDAKIAKMKDGTTHLAYKPEHAVDLDTGAVIAAELHPADRGDTTTLAVTLTAAEANLAAVDKAPTAEDPADLVTDKGYFGREVLKPLEDGPWKTRIAEPKGKGVSRWHGDDDARRAVYNNRARSSNARSLTSSIAAACAGPGCAVERTFTSAISSTSPSTISGF